jgi:hypothetical protein
VGDDYLGGVSFLGGVWGGVVVGEDSGIGETEMGEEKNGDIRRRRGWRVRRLLLRRCRGSLLLLVRSWRREGGGAFEMPFYLEGLGLK